MDKAELSRLVQDHQEMVFSIAMSVLRDRHAAEDVTQEVFMKTLDSIGGLRDPARIKPWLAAMTRNRAFDRLRARRRLDALLLRKASEPHDSGDEEPAPDIASMLLGLKEGQQQIILLRYVQRLSYREISAALGLSVSAVGELLHRIRRAILRNFKESVDAV